MTNLFYGAGRQQLNNTYYLAIDIGASSGRHVLGHVEDGIMKLEEVYRFENRQVTAGSGLSGGGGSRSGGSAGRIGR